MSKSLQIPNFDHSIQLSVVIHEPILSATTNLTLFFAHATGFHKEAWNPVLLVLAQAGIRATCICFDMWNHGDSALMNQGKLPEKYQWSFIGEDIRVILQHLRVKGPIIGIGHSIGAISMLYCELKYPATFARIVAFEPILVIENDPRVELFTNLFISMASKRKYQWKNREEARNSLLKKEFFARFDPSALEIYLDHGFWNNGDSFELKCVPAQEALTFSCNDISVYCSNNFNKLRIPVLFVGGGESNYVEADVTIQNAMNTPLGRYVILTGISHPIPMESPSQTGRILLQEIAAHQRT